MESFFRIKTFKSLKEVMESFFNGKNFKGPKKVTGSFSTIKNLKSRKAVIELILNFKSFKSRKKLTESFFTGHASLSFHIFFLSGFSFTDNDDSQGSREGRGPSFILLYHFHRLTNIQALIWNFGWLSLYMTITYF